MEPLSDGGGDDDDDQEDAVQIFSSVPTALNIKHFIATNSNDILTDGLDRWYGFVATPSDVGEPNQLHMCCYIHNRGRQTRTRGGNSLLPNYFPQQDEVLKLFTIARGQQFEAVSVRVIGFFHTTRRAETVGRLIVTIESAVQERFSLTSLRVTHNYFRVTKVVRRKHTGSK